MASVTFPSLVSFSHSPDLFCGNRPLAYIYTQYIHWSQKLSLLRVFTLLARHGHPQYAVATGWRSGQRLHGRWRVLGHLCCGSYSHRPAILGPRKYSRCGLGRLAHASDGGEQELRYYYRYMSSYQRPTIDTTRRPKHCRYLPGIRWRLSPPLLPAHQSGSRTSHTSHQGLLHLSISCHHGHCYRASFSCCPGAANHGHKLLAQALLVVRYGVDFSH